MVKRNIIVLLLCVIVSAGIAAASDPAGRSLQYQVKLRSASFGDMGARRMWLKGDKVRWECQSDRLTIRLVKNERGVFLIHPWNKVAAQYPSGSNRANPATFLPGPNGPTGEFLRKVKAVKHGREKVEGRACVRYSYTERTTGRKCRLWVSVNGGKPVKLVMEGKRGKLDTITAKYTRFVLGGKISDSLFQVPAGYKIRPMPQRRLASAKRS